MEKNIYSFFNNELSSKIKSLGFKKKRDLSFFRKIGATIHELGFTHSTHHESHIRYYTITVSIEHQKVVEIVNALGVIIGGMGINIGYLSPEHNFIEWRISETSLEEEVSKVVSDMYCHIINYAVPYFNRYSDIKNVIADTENNILTNHLDIPHRLPILYYLNNEKEFAVSYMQRELNKRKYLYNKRYDDFPFSTPNIETDVITSEERIYKEYQTFVDKLMQYTSVHEKFRDNSK